MKECRACRALVSNDRTICGVCGTPLEGEAPSLEKARTVDALAQAGSAIRDSFALLRRHPDLFLLPSLLLVAWLSLVGVPAMVLFGQAQLSDGLGKMLTFLDIRSVKQPVGAAVLQLRSASLFGTYFWAYSLIVSTIIAVLYAGAFPVSVDQAVKTGRVNVEAALRHALTGFKGTVAALILYSGIVFVTGIILLDFIFLPAGNVFGDIAALIAGILFTFFWSYATLRLWLVFPAIGIDKARSSEAFGLSLDATRKSARSSYMCILAILGVLSVARAAVYAALTLTSGTLIPGIVAVAALVVSGTIAGVIPSVYYYEVALRTRVGSLVRPPSLEALQEAR